MNKTTLSVTLFLSSVMLAPAAFGAKPNILYATASQYQNAIERLELVIDQSREIRSADRNMVNKLDLAAKRMVAAAKNPRHINRLRFERKRVIPLQLQVEANLFEKYSPNLELVKTWEYLLWTQALFEQELAFYVEEPSRGNSVRRRINSSQPSRYLSLPSGFEPTPVRPFDPVITR